MIFFRSPMMGAPSNISGQLQAAPAAPMGPPAMATATQGMPAVSPQTVVGRPAPTYGRR